MATLLINNFTGALTRQNFGNINSGLAFFDTSFGYNPFFNTGSLTWFKAPGVGGVNSGLALASCSRMESGVLATYIITNTGHLFRMTGDGSGGTDLYTLVNAGQGVPTFTYGGDMTFFGLNTLMIAHDQGVTKITLTSAGAFVSQADVGAWDATHFTPITTMRRMCQAFGLLYVINSGPSVTYADNLAEISNAGVVNNYAKFINGFGGGTFIRDLDISADLTYLLISSSIVPSELIAPVNDTINSAAGESTLFKWNGITAGSLVQDAAYTVGASLPNFGVTALSSFSGKEYLFMYDTFGTALYESNSKKWTLRNQKSPMPGATASAGNFITWTSPDFYFNDDTGTGNIFGSMYYYGRLDENMPIGLWRVFRQTSALTGGGIYSMPFNQFSANRYVSVNSSATVQVDTNGTHLFSFIDYSGSGGSTVNNNYYFYASPPDDSPGGWTGAIAGVYQTQTQMFPQKVTWKQVRVYCNPTVANNGFQVDLIGPDNKKIANSTGTYTFAAGGDPTKLQGALDRINLNFASAPSYGVALRITNTGTTNMTINKVELDTMPSGK